MKKKIFVLSFLCLAIGHGTVVQAIPSNTDLQKIQQKIKEEQKSHQQLQEKAKSVASEVSLVQKKMVKAASSVQDFEETLNKLEQKLNELKLQETSLKQQFAIKQSQLMKLLSGLQKIAINPPEILIFQTQTPVQTLRSAILLKESCYFLQADTEQLQKDLDMLTSLQAAMRSQTLQIKVASARLETEKENMEKLMKQKFVLQTHFETESNQAKQKSEILGKQAKDLKDLLNQLQKERQQLSQLAKRHKPVPIKDIPTISRQSLAFMKSKGNIPLPARGKIIQSYGDILESGLKAKGITMQTRPTAQVVSPFDGTILFAGIFKSYGNLLIIEHGEGFVSLLAGLGQINATVGQTILTGEPIGNMSTTEPQKLYIEIRQEGEPLNPSEWFFAYQQKKGRK